MRTFRYRTSTAWSWIWPISCPSSRGSSRGVSDDKQSVKCSGWRRVAAPSSDQSNPAVTPEQLAESVFGKQFPGRITESYPLEVTNAFPVGHSIVECLNLKPGCVRVKFNDLSPEGPTRQFALVQQVSRFAQRFGQRPQFSIDVSVAVIIFAAIELLFDARHPGGEHRRNRQIRICVRARQAVLDAKGLAVTHHAKADR